MALVVGNLLASAGNGRDMGLILGLEESPGEECDGLLWYSCLESPMDEGAWRASVRGITGSWTRLSQCSHEIKRRLLLGRKVMTSLDSIFKSRDITLPTKVHLVKAMVFPVVMYGCESWTVKKAEC